MPFSYDVKSGRYKDERGRFIKADKVVELSHASLTGTEDFVSSLVGQKLRAKEFVKVLREEIKAENIRQYVLGRGGLAQMTKKDWGTVGAVTKEQYGYLSGLVEAMPDLSEAQLANRAGMYISAANEAFEKGRLAAVKSSGEFTEERWVMDPAKEHCKGCTELAGKGWVKIGELGSFPGDGSTECLTKCGCHIEYR